MENFQRQLWSAIDHFRGSMEMTHLIEFFTYVAFIAKEAPESFQVIKNAGQVKQMDALISAGKLLEGMHPHEVCEAPNKHKVDVRVINVATQIIAEVTDFKLLAQQLRELTKEAGKMGADLASNLNMERIFSALVGDCSGKTLYDGTCGLARIASNLNTEKLYLEEKSYSTWVTTYRLLTLEDKAFKLTLGDSLLNSAYGDDSKFDLAVMEPPLALKIGAEERRMLAEASFVVVPTGNIASANASDSLWIQQALSKLNDTGKGYILLPQGLLFRGGYDAKVREYLLENELLEAVIGLPASILDRTGIPPVLLVLNKNKTTGSPVIFVDASDIGKSHRGGIEISEVDAKLIASLALGNLPEDARYKAMLIPEIRDQNNELSISRYIVRNIEVETLDVVEEFKKLSNYHDAFKQSQEKLSALLEKFQ